MLALCPSLFAMTGACGGIRTHAGPILKRLSLLLDYTGFENECSR